MKNYLKNWGLFFGFFFYLTAVWATSVIASLVNAFIGKNGDFISWYCELFANEGMKMYQHAQKIRDESLFGNAIKKMQDEEDDE